MSTLSAAARKVIRLAIEEAQRFNHEYIGTEHILLGLVKEGCSVAANVLTNLDIDLDRIRVEVEKIVQSGPDPVSPSLPSATPRAQSAIRHAIEEACTLGDNDVGTEHLLLGLLREEEGVAAQVLMNLGLNLGELTNEVQRWRWVPQPSWRMWNDDAVTKMARVIDTERHWAELPLLADALEDAGCADRAILNHLRRPGAHVSSCWVIDRLLGREPGREGGPDATSPQAPSRQWWQFWK